ncbi:hypothetical protein TNCV_168791 [Trichonephila clavipes]|nr:hypothetical protein TNCV_168791 [Trichonephila clavipes]
MAPTGIFLGGGRWSKVHQSRVTPQYATKLILLIVSIFGNKKQYENNDKYRHIEREIANHGKPARRFVRVRVLVGLSAKPIHTLKTVRTPSHDRDESDFSVDQETVRHSFTCFKSAEVD